MIADLNADLLKEVTRIANALNKPANSPLVESVKTIAPFLAGLITAYISLLLQGWLSERREQQKMRRFVYSELAGSFFLINDMIRAATEAGLRPRFRLLKTLCAFEGETYMKENRHVFYQLLEASTLSILYSELHTMRVGETYPLSFFRIPLVRLSDAFKTDPNIRKYFKQFTAPDIFQKIEQIVEHNRDLKIDPADLFDLSGLAANPKPSSSEPDI